MVQLFFLAVLCNVLVCLAVWMSFGGRTTTDKVMVIVPPIAAFVAAGFEHSIANLYLLPYALAIKAWAGAEFWTALGLDAGAAYPDLTVGGALHNIVVATLGEPRRRQPHGGCGVLARLSPSPRLSCRPLP
jgi:formate transporter